MAWEMLERQERGRYMMRGVKLDLELFARKFQANRVNVIRKQCQFCAHKIDTVFGSLRTYCQFVTGSNVIRKRRSFEKVCFIFDCYPELIN
jgi:hypothetical protein